MLGTQVLHRARGLVAAALVASAITGASSLNVGPEILDGIFREIEGVARASTAG